ncbi:hypothetical protein YIM_02170 [Amycolatopsis sp. YIM 10]|nr:hypothetical protein YIM_02170 [Amycolatopsis sp. YIM 10]
MKHILTKCRWRFTILAERGFVPGGLDGVVTLAAMSAKWEYATVPLLIHATKQILDQWGEDGWELVTVLPNPTGEQHVAYLKRQKG